MNPKSEYGGMMEKRQGSGRSYGGGSSHFNPFAHDGQGQYDDPYKKKENVSRTVVAAQNDLSFLPGSHGQQQSQQSGGSANTYSRNTVDTARNNAPRSWKENQARARGSNVFSNSANYQVKNQRQEPVWQDSARGRQSTRNAHFHAMDQSNENNSNPAYRQQQQYQPQQQYSMPAQQQQHHQPQQYSMPPQQQQQTAVDYAYQQMQQFDNMRGGSGAMTSGGMGGTTVISKLRSKLQIHHRSVGVLLPKSSSPDPPGRAAKDLTIKLEMPP